jgi:hypothetical protein
MRRKEGKRHRRMNRWYHWCIASEHLVHCATTGIILIPSDELTTPFLVASDELQRKSSKDSSTGWSHGLSEDTIGLSDALNQDRDAPRWSLQHRMNWRLGQVEVSVYPMVAWKLPETFWLRGLQHRMNRCTVGVMRRSSYVSGSSTAKWRGGHRMNRRLENA